MLQRRSQSGPNPELYIQPMKYKLVNEKLRLQSWSLWNKRANVRKNNGKLFGGADEPHPEIDELKAR